MFAKSPMNLPAVWLKVKEYPQKNHWKLMTAADMTESQMSERADLRRARPE
jgi:hypothetical protein